MSLYSQVCLACPSKIFIEPGTEKLRTARHAGEDGERLDADHRAVPIALSAGMAQQSMLDRAMELIRQAMPTARFVDLATSDQGAYGFVLMSVTDDNKTELMPDWNDFGNPLAEAIEEVENQINDLNWGGVVGEGPSGNVRIDIREVKVISSS